MIAMHVREAVDLQQDEGALQSAPPRALQLVDELLAKRLEAQHRRQRVAAATQQRRFEVGDALAGRFELPREPVTFAASRHSHCHRRDGRWS